MKLSRIALGMAVLAACCVGVRAFQRVADFGFGNDDSPNNVKSEFYWSRLAYTSSMSSYGGYSGLAVMATFGVAARGRGTIPRPTASS